MLLEWNHLYDFLFIFCVVSVQTCGLFVNVNFACWYFALWVRSLGQEEPLEEGSATHSGILAWGIPWTEEPTGLQSMGLQRVGHDWSGLVCTHFVELVLTVFVCMWSLRFPPHKIIWSAYRDNFIFSFPNWMSSIASPWNFQAFNRLQISKIVIVDRFGQNNRHLGWEINFRWFLLCYFLESSSMYSFYIFSCVKVVVILIGWLIQAVVNIFGRCSCFNIISYVSYGLFSNNGSEIKKSSQCIFGRNSCNIPDSSWNT